MTVDPIEEIAKLIGSGWAGEPMTTRFLDRLAAGKLSREENPASHFCVYFAAYDPAERQVFIGHHIKSGLWLFNGGHMDQGEAPQTSLHREIGEEWGVTLAPDAITGPTLLTITPIDPARRHSCREHYDLWYFVQVDRDHFTPDPARLAEEFYTNRWATFGEARQCVTDRNTLQAIALIEDASAPVGR